MEIKISNETIESARLENKDAVLVYFAHDIEDGWYEALFPFGYGDMSGAYGSAGNLRKCCENWNLDIVWLGGTQYLPWKDKNE